jgi:hypothetical protein
MAAAPVISATSLASSLGIAVKNASPLLEALVERGIAIEVTHRSKRWLYGLKDLAPLREEVSPPCRTTPGRRRGRPPSESTGSRDCSRRFLPGRRRLAALNRPSLAARAQGVRISDLSRWMQEADGDKSDKGRFRTACNLAPVVPRESDRDPGSEWRRRPRACRNRGGRGVACASYLGDCPGEGARTINYTIPPNRMRGPAEGAPFLVGEGEA